MQTKHLPTTAVLSVALACLGLHPGKTASAQDLVIPVGVATFQDDSNSNASPEFRQELARALQQKLLARKDLLPRMLNADTGPGAPHVSSIGELASLGRQSGVAFVIRGGLLAAVLEPSASKNRVSVSLYVEVISVESASVAATLRGEGAATQAEPLVPVAAVDVSAEHFRRSAMGLAISAALNSIAEPLHQALSAAPAPSIPPSATPATEAVQPILPPPATTESAPPFGTADATGASGAEADAELQQLIAQAESIVLGSASASTSSVEGVRQALDDLWPVLTAKADLMQRGGDTTQADRDIAARKDALQVAVTRVTTEVTASAATSPIAASEQPVGEKKMLLASIDESADSVLSILQKIQQIRATVREARESGARSPTDVSSGTSSTPVEQRTAEGSGVVVDESGRPVEGAEVTDPASGATTTTDSSGVYRLSGLPAVGVVTLVVRKGALQTSAPVEVLRNHPAAIDFRLRPGSVTAAKRAPLVLPATVLISPVSSRRTDSGVLTGVVRDASGRPAARAVVTLKGLGVARTDSLGRYTFLNVPAGPHELLINQSGSRTRSMRVQVAAAPSATTPVPPSRPGVRLPPSAIAVPLKPDLGVSAGDVRCNVARGSLQCAALVRNLGKGPANAAVASFALYADGRQVARGAVPVDIRADASYSARWSTRVPASRRLEVEVSLSVAQDANESNNRARIAIPR